MKSHKIKGDDTKPIYKIKDNNAAVKGFCPITGEKHNDAELPYWVFDENGEPLSVKGMEKECPELLKEVQKMNDEHPWLFVADDAEQTTLFQLMESIQEATGCASCVFGELKPEAGGIVCHIREDGYTGELPRKIDYDYPVNIYSCGRWATTPKQLKDYEHIVQGKRQKITIILS